MILTKEEKIRYVKEYNEGKPIRTGGIQEQGGLQELTPQLGEEIQQRRREGIGQKARPNSYA